MQNYSSSKDSDDTNPKTLSMGKDHRKKPSKSKQGTYRTHKQNMVRITLSISPNLLERIDEAAEQDYTTRSDMIRMAVLWYLRPQGRELDQADPDVILKTLQHRHALAEFRKAIKATDAFDD